MSQAQLETAAAILGPLVDDVVFVGGATIHLWITEPAAPPVRATEDVDVICEVASRVGYYKLADRLRDRGLFEAIDDPVICRWHSRDPELVLDVMPTSPDVLGFSNPWYGDAIASARAVTLDSGVTIWAAAPPALVATKLGAWVGRGKGDLLRSLDIHDVLTLIDGRPDLVGELASAPPALRAFVAEQLAQIREHSYYGYAIDSAAAGYGSVGRERADLIRSRVDEILQTVK